MSERTRPTGGTKVGLLVAGLGILLLVAVLPFYLASGLMAPGWAVVGLLVVWAGLVALGVRWFRRAPYRVPALPVAAALIWFGVMFAGDNWLGWTA